MTKRTYKKTLLALLAIIVLLAQFTQVNLSSTVTKTYQTNGVMQHLDKKIEKLNNYSSNTLYTVSIINTTSILNDDVYLYEFTDMFNVINSTLLINSTRVRKLKITDTFLGNVMINNSTLKSLDNHTRYYFVIQQPAGGGTLVKIGNSTIMNANLLLYFILASESNIFKIENVTFSDSRIEIFSSNYITFKNCTFINSTINLYSSSYINITDSQFIDAGLTGIDSSHTKFLNLTFNQTENYKQGNLVELRSMTDALFSNNTIYGRRDYVTIIFPIENVTIDNNKLYNSSFKICSISSDATIFGPNNLVNDLPVVVYKNTSYVSLKDQQVGEIIAYFVDNLSLIDVTASGIFLLQTNNTLIEGYSGQDGGLGIYLVGTINTTISQVQIENIGDPITIEYSNNLEISSAAIRDVQRGIKIDQTTDVQIEKSQVSNVLSGDGIYISNSKRITLEDVTVYDAPEKDVTIESSEEMKLIDLYLYDGGFYPLVNSTAFATFTINNIYLNNVPIEIHYNKPSLNITDSGTRQIIAFDIAMVTLVDVNLNETNILLNTVESAIFNDSSIENAYFGIFMYSVNKLFISNLGFYGNLYGVYSYYNNSVLNITDSEFSKNTYGFYAQNVECWIRDNNFISNTFALYDTQTNVKGYVFLNSFIENTYDYLTKDPEALSDLLLTRLGIGNYWDKFEGVDTNGDMLSERIYLLDDANNTDYAPFVEPPHYEEQISNYTILIVNGSWLFKEAERQIVFRPIYVLNTTLLENITFHYNVNDISVAIPMIKLTSTELYTAYLSLYQNNTTLTYWLEIHYMNKTYYSQSREFTISVDTLNASVPNILDVTFNSSIYANESLVITANITDVLDIIQVQVRYNTTDGWLTKEMVFSETLNQYIAIFQTLEPGNFTFQIYVENMMAFSNATEYYTVEIKEYKTQDTQPPRILSVLWSPEAPFVNSTLTIFATVIDNVGIQNVTAQITVNGTTEIYVLTKLGNETYSVTFATPQTATTVSVTIIATDINNNTVTSKEYHITILDLPALQTSTPTEYSIIEYVIIAVLSATLGAVVSFVVMRYVKRQKNK